VVLAYLQVLSDSQKRAVYDQYGEEALKGQAPPPGAGGPSGSSYYGGDGSTFRFNPRSADDIFAEFFGFSSPFSGMGGMGGMGGGAGDGGLWLSQDLPSLEDYGVAMVVFGGISSLV
jgi:DnaJ family protein B protein 4